MSDEGFHEIQLNGKQLVFLFMAATVVSVVIFLCGVMVGRGVRSQQGPVESAELGTTTSEEPRREPGIQAEAPPPAPASTTPGAATVPPDPEDDPTDYYKVLTDAEGGAEKVSPPSTEPRDAPAARPAPAERPATSSAPPAVAAAPAAVVGDGFVVQVAALRDRSEADAIVKRLAGKGYQAFVVNPVPGKPPVYKVQVGRFPARGDAEKTAARLKSQEQYSPWVTR